MDLSSIIGWIFGFAIIILGITLENLGNFVDENSLLIVLAERFSRSVIWYSFSALKNVGAHIKCFFREININLKKRLRNWWSWRSLREERGFYPWRRRLRKWRNLSLRKAFY